MISQQETKEGKVRLQKVLLIGLLFGIVTVTSSVAAQSITPADQEESNRRTQQEAEERQSREQAKDTFLQPKMKSMEETKLPVEDLSFTIHTLTLEGERVNQFPCKTSDESIDCSRLISQSKLCALLKTEYKKMLVEGKYITT